MNVELVRERVLSLIPHKETGEFVHGAKKEFAEKIGVSPKVLNHWVSGRSNSFVDYLTQIATTNDVSVAWLMGINSENTKMSINAQSLSNAIIGDGNTHNTIGVIAHAPLEDAILAAFKQLTEAEKAKVVSFAYEIIEKR